MITINKLSSVVGALVVSAVLGSQPALAAPDNSSEESVQCRIDSALIYTAVGRGGETVGPTVLTLNGVGFTKGDRDPVVKIAGEVVEFGVGNPAGDQYEEISHNRITIDVEVLDAYSGIFDKAFSNGPNEDPPTSVPLQGYGVGFTIEVIPGPGQGCHPYMFSTFLPFQFP